MASSLMNGESVPTKPLACLRILNHTRAIRKQSHFWRTPSLNVFRFRCHADFVVRPKCHPDFINYRAPRRCRDAGAIPQALAQSDDADPEMRIQQLENQLRQLTGQNEELQYRNRQLEERLRQLGGARRAPAVSRPVAQPNVAAAPPVQAQPAAAPAGPGYPRRQPQQPAGLRQQQIAAPAPIVQEPPAPAAQAAAAAMPSIPTRIRMRPARRARSAAANCRSQRSAGRRSRRTRSRASRSISATPARAIPAGALPPPRRARRQRRADHLAAVGNAEGRIRSRHRLHAAQGLCAGRRDHAQFRAEISERSLIADSQYWLGESFFQRQQYRDAAEAFLGVTTKFDKSAKGAGRPAAARPIAGGAEGEGSRLRRARRGDAEISARLGGVKRPWTVSRSGLSAKAEAARSSACGLDPQAVRDRLRNPLRPCPTTTIPRSRHSQAKRLFADWKGRPRSCSRFPAVPILIALMWLAARWRRALARGPRLDRRHRRSWLAAEAAREARDVKRLARSLDLPHRTLRWTGAKPKTGCRPRRGRRAIACWRKAARASGATHVLTAHTRDDQAETLLMRMLRGSGIAGLAAMARETSAMACWLARPLLEMFRRRSWSRR
jgi:TolA-binding protein